MMKKCLRRFIILCLLLLTGLNAQTLQASPEEVDSLQVSFITCAPGENAYELFGHTALRVKDLKDGRDLVFNYGVFDFDTPHFALRFMLGQTDYCLGVSDYEAFVYSYEHRGRRVDEQVLNLTEQEKIRIFNALLTNWMERGWSYRYNFLYDNCTTRAYHHIKDAVEGRLVLSEKATPENDTFRDILHEFSETQSPWMAFGDDLVLGKEVDQTIGVEQQLFSPIYAHRILDKTMIEGPDGTKRPLVIARNVLVKGTNGEIKGFWITPHVLVTTLLALLLGLSILELKRGKMFLLVDYLLLALLGTAGCIVAFLFFFSEHPAVGSNALVVLLNPLPLLYLPYKIWLDRNGKKDYSYITMAVLTILCLLACMVMGQNIPNEMYLLALILLLRFILFRSLSGGDSGVKLAH